MKSLAEIEDRWSIDTLLDANMTLDIWDDLQRPDEPPKPEPTPVDF